MFDFITIGSATIDAFVESEAADIVSVQKRQVQSLWHFHTEPKWKSTVSEQQ